MWALPGPPRGTDRGGHAQARGPGCWLQPWQRLITLKAIRDVARGLGDGLPLSVREGGGGWPPEPPGAAGGLQLRSSAYTGSSHVT